MTSPTVKSASNDSTTVTSTANVNELPARSTSGSAFQRGGVVTVGAVTLAVVGGDVATVAVAATVVDVVATSAGRVVDVGVAVVLVAVVDGVDVDGVDVDEESAEAPGVVAPTSPEPPSQLAASSASTAMITADPRAGSARGRRERSLVAGVEIRGCRGRSSWYSSL